MLFKSLQMRVLRWNFEEFDFCSNVISFARIIIIIDIHITKLYLLVRFSLISIHFFQATRDFSSIPSQKNLLLP